LNCFKGPVTQRKEDWNANAYSFEKLGIQKTTRNRQVFSKLTGAHVKSTAGMRVRYESMLEDTSGSRESLVDSW
jgi:hypothetical protein